MAKGSYFVLQSTTRGSSGCFGFFFCPTHLTEKMQNKEYKNAPYSIELYCIVKSNLKIFPFCSCQIEVRDRCEPRYGVQRLHWGQKWNPFHLSYMTPPNYFCLKIRILLSLNASSECTGFCKLKKKKHTWLYFEEHKIHGCTVNLTLGLISEFLYDGEKCCLKYWFVSIFKLLRGRTIISIYDLIIHFFKTLFYDWVLCAV